MFEYMRARNGNIIAVVDKKKNRSSGILKISKDIPFVTFKENGNVSAESLKAMLVKGRMNYVVMETGNTWMIKTTVEAMLSSMLEYQLQLVILEPNETLDTDEIKFLEPNKIKINVSVTRDGDSAEALILKKNLEK
jgi:hypothetical protein